MATTGALSNYAENKLLDHVLGVAPFTQPTVYLALLSSASTDTTMGTEITGTWYSRKPVVFDAAIEGTSNNNSIVDYGIVTDAAVSITHWALLDNTIDGNMLIYGEFSNPQIASPGNHVFVPVASLNISAD